MRRKRYELNNDSVYETHGLSGAVALVAWTVLRL